MPLGATSMTVSLRGLFTQAFDLATGSVDLNFARGINLDPGTGANQADRIWHDTRTLAPSATEDLDLVGVALLDPFGTAVTFARVKGIVVFAASANVNNVVIGGTANSWATLLSPAATGLLTLRPGALFAAFAPDATAWATTAATGDLVHVANSAAGTSVNYDIVVVGASV